MPTDLAETDARRQARRERAFYAHLAKFAVTMAVLVTVNLLTSPGYLWFFWPLLGWGFGLTKHAASVFGTHTGQAWVDRRTRELMGEEATDARLRTLLDETLDARALPPGAPQDLARLQRRIEHLEAIVTATDDPLAAETAPPRPDRIGHRINLDLDGLDADRLDPAPPVRNRGRGGAAPLGR
ncbi:2TM domain-containing protein [Rubrivirga litoralis]|uniref:2TM domain-containing protein n=1 Tax=Rubrivirga litoralis TaxID=3075598 RepID=A0ABU3BNT4_9BACT|nr:2TM domain-containing protein [Rubrivirga sp. F394]MDT0630890.1 2TM domain-containing protein [Rubrivirga sp. F394]